jgi:hypothetical protein
MGLGLWLLGAKTSANVSSLVTKAPGVVRAACKRSLIGDEIESSPSIASMKTLVSR